MPGPKRSSRSGKTAASRTRSSRAAAQPTSRICSRCGFSRLCAPGGVPLGWTVMFDAGRTQFLCVDCSRANIRAIEGKLPEEFWE